MAAISEAMLATAILEYLEEHTKEFEKFLLDRYEVLDNWTVTWRGGIPAERRLTLTITGYAQDGAKLAEDDYALQLERVGKKVA